MLNVKWIFISRTTFAFRLILPFRFSFIAATFCAWTDLIYDFHIDHK